MAKRLTPKYKKRRKAQSGRKTDNSKFYQSRQWRKVRALFVSLNPLCVKCEERGLVVPVAEVDHIKPIRLGGAEFDFENLQSLCKSCHARKSASEKYL